MNCDSAFPDYTKKITYLLLVLAAVGGIVTQLIWGWRVSVAFSLAALFHAAFFLFLRKMYLFWTETGRDNLFIGRRIAGVQQHRHRSLACRVDDSFAAGQQITGA